MFTNWNKGWVDVDVVFFKNIKIQKIYLDTRTKSEKKNENEGPKFFQLFWGPSKLEENKKFVLFINKWLYYTKKEEEKF